MYIYRRSLIFTKYQHILFIGITPHKINSTLDILYRWIIIPQLNKYYNYINKKRGGFL